jgi:hypothetical protein
LHFMTIYQPFRHVLVPARSKNMQSNKFDWQMQLDLAGYPMIKKPAENCHVFSIWTCFMPRNCHGYCELCLTSKLNLCPAFATKSE